MLTVGSLFSGIGGFDLGLERAGMRIEWQVEIDDYCRAVLGKHWPHVPCHADITTIDWEWIPRVDLVCGGFPCQPFSAAGKRRGKEDDRYLWPEVVRCLAVVRPTWFLGENVYGLLHLGIEQMYADLEALGYQVAILGIPACAVDAPHLRKRIWILAHHAGVPHRKSVTGESGRQIQQSGECSISRVVADATQLLQYRSGDTGETRRSKSADSSESIPNPHEQSVGRATKSWRQHSQWPTEPNVGRVADGVPSRVDRLKGLGNAIVPQIAEALGRMIVEVS